MDSRSLCALDIHALSAFTVLVLLTRGLCTPPPAWRPPAEAARCNRHRLSSICGRCRRCGCQLKWIGHWRSSRQIIYAPTSSEHPDPSKRRVILRGLDLNTLNVHFLACKFAAGSSLKIHGQSTRAKCLHPCLRSLFQGATNVWMQGQMLAHTANLPCDGRRHCQSMRKRHHKLRW